MTTAPVPAVTCSFASSCSSAAAFCAFADSCACRRCSSDGNAGRIVGEIDSGCWCDGTGSPALRGTDAEAAVAEGEEDAEGRTNPGHSTSPLASLRSLYKFRADSEKRKVDGEGSEEEEEEEDGGGTAGGAVAGAADAAGATAGAAGGGAGGSHDGVSTI